MKYNLSNIGKFVKSMQEIGAVKKVFYRLKQNPAGEGQGFEWTSRIKATINAFATDAVCGGPIGIEETRRSQPRWSLSLLPLFASFFGNHEGRSSQENNSNHTKYNSNWQGKVFEEITGKANAQNIRAKVAENFSNKFPGFFIKEMAHKQLLSLGSVSESSSGETTVDETDGKFKQNAFGVTRLMKYTISNM